jgi:hypothetical protein
MAESAGAPTLSLSKGQDARRERPGRTIVAHPTNQDP